MNDGEFSSNFTWYEWGFVSPEQLPTEDMPDAEAEVTAYHYGSVETWNEDNRWMT